MRNILISDVRCRGNGRLSNNGNGINGQGSGYPGETYYAHDIVINGGVFEENASNGILCSLSHTIIQGALVKNNRGAGIFVSYLAHFVTISNVRCIRNGINENGFGLAGSTNIAVMGASYIKLLGCTCLGTEPVSLDAMSLEDMEAAVANLYQIPNNEMGLTKWNLIIHDVEVDGVYHEVHDVEVHHFTGRYAQSPGGLSQGDRFGIYCYDRTKAIFYHQGTGDPTVIGAPGTKDSQYLQTDAADNESPIWVKVEISPPPPPPLPPPPLPPLIETQKVGWVRVGIG